MPTARAVAIAALTVSAWALWALAGLLAIYVLMSWRTGDPAFKIAYLALAGGACVAGGVVVRRLAGRITRSL